MVKEDEIRIIAYSLWVQDGYNHTSAIRHWLRAEAIWEQYQKAIQSSDQTNKVLNENLDAVSKARTC